MGSVREVGRYSGEKAEGWRTDDDRTVTEFYVAEVSQNRMFLLEGTRCDEPLGSVSCSRGRTPWCDFHEAIAEVGPLPQT